MDMYVSRSVTNCTHLFRSVRVPVPWPAGRFEEGDAALWNRSATDRFSHLLRHFVALDQTAALTRDLIVNDRVLAFVTKREMFRLGALIQLAV